MVRVGPQGVAESYFFAKSAKSENRKVNRTPQSVRVADMTTLKTARYGKLNDCSAGFPDNALSLAHRASRFGKNRVRAPK